MDRNVPGATQFMRIFSFSFAADRDMPMTACLLAHYTEALAKPAWPSTLAADTCSCMSFLIPQERLIVAYNASSRFNMI